MKYESEFRIKEKEFRPRKNFKHREVVDELANIVKRADLDIEEMDAALTNEANVNEQLYNELSLANDEIRTYKGMCFLLTLCVVILGITALS